MRHEIEVKESNGNNLFLLQNEEASIFFEKLPMLDVLAGGKLELVRNDEVLSQASSIRTIGTAVTATVLYGLDEVFEKSANTHGIIDLFAGQFHSNDKIIIDAPNDTHENGFVAYLLMQERVRTRKIMSQSTIGSP